MEAQRETYGLTALWSQDLSHPQQNPPPFLEDGLRPLLYCWDVCF